MLLNKNISNISPIVLEYTEVKSSIVDICVNATYTQIYTNKSDSNVETLFSFPLPPNARVTQFEAVVDGKLYKGHLSKLEKSVARYEDQIASGKTAYMGEQVKDSFRLSIGNFPSNTMATIHFSWILELAYDSNAKLNFSLPPLPVLPSHGYKILPISIQLMVPVLEITSKSGHVILSDVNENTAIIRVDPKEEDNKNKFSLEVTAASLPDIFRPMLELCDDPDMKEYCYALRVSLPSLKAASPTSTTTKREFIFLLDCSGSMEGESIKQSVRSMNFFLSSLPSGNLFNIFLFGSNYKSLFEKSEELSDTNLKRAREYLRTVKADMGGTALLSPLNVILGSPFLQNTKRVLFVLTDGQVDGPSVCIEKVKKASHSCQVFTLGLGNSVDVNLVEGLAQAGNGTCELVRDVHSNMQRKILGQLQWCVSEPYSNISVNFGGIPEFYLSYYDPSTKSHQWPNLYSNENHLFYALVKNIPSKTTLTFSATYDNNPITYQYEVDPTVAIQGRTIHLLAAVKWINWMGDSPKNSESVEKLSRQFGVATDFTSFTILPSTDPPPVYGSMELLTKIQEQLDAETQLRIETRKEQELKKANEEEKAKMEKEKQRMEKEKEEEKQRMEKEKKEEEKQKMEKEKKEEEEKQRIEKEKKEKEEEKQRMEKEKKEEEKEKAMKSEEEKQEMEKEKKEEEKQRMEKEKKSEEEKEKKEEEKQGMEKEKKSEEEKQRMEKEKKEKEKQRIEKVKSVEEEEKMIEEFDKKIEEGIKRRKEEEFRLTVERAMKEWRAKLDAKRLEAWIGETPGIEDFFYFGKLANSTQRYEDMLSYMSYVCEKKTQSLTIEERDLFSIAAKSCIGELKAYYKLLNPSRRQKISDSHLRIVPHKLNQLYAEITALSLSLVDSVMVHLPHENNFEGKVFFLKMKGDLYKNIAEMEGGEEWKVPAEKSYETAMALANGNLPHTNTIFLSLALNMSVFFYEVMNEPSKATDLSKKAFDNGIAQLDCLTEDSYKESTVIMQLLRDNLSMWTSSDCGDDEDDEDVHDNMSTTACVYNPKDKLNIENSYGFHGTGTQKPLEIMDQLLFCQNANGSWTVTDEIIQILGKSKESIFNNIPVEDHDAWVTALVIIFLEIYFLAQKQDWIMIFNKAETYLQQIGKSHFLVTARSFLKL